MILWLYWAVKKISSKCHRSPVPKSPQIPKSQIRITSSFIFVQNICILKYVLTTKVTICLLCRCPSIYRTFSSIAFFSNDQHLAENMGIASLKFTLTNRSFSKWIFGKKVNNVGTSIIFVYSGLLRIFTGFPERKILSYKVWLRSSLTKIHT